MSLFDQLHPDWQEALSELRGQIDLIDSKLQTSDVAPEYENVMRALSVSIESISGLSLSTENKEHLTSYFYANPSKFKIKNLENEQDISSINLCVDTPVDLLRLQVQMERFH